MWGLQRGVNRMKDVKYPTNARNWRDQAFNECARTAADAEVRRIERKCLNTNPDECNDLGMAAASFIVQNYCGIRQFNTNSRFKRRCREVANNICKGAILPKIRANSSCRVPSTNQLLRLQNQCMPKIREWTPNSEEEADEFEFFTDNK